MKKFFDKVKAILAFTVFLIIIVSVLTVVEGVHRNVISDWAEKNNYEVIEVKRSLTIIGTPFAYGDLIYKATMKNKNGEEKTFWFRNDLGFTSIEEELVDGRYKKIK